MTNPTLTKTYVSIKYTSNDKYRLEWTGKGGKGSTQGLSGKEVSPEITLLAALEELARITALFGFEKEALELFTAAQQRIADWKTNHKEAING